MKKKYWKKRDYHKISEDEIKNKLYGGAEKKGTEPLEKKEPKIEKNLFPQQELIAKKESNLLEKKFLLDKGIQDELDILKQSILNLEDKLKKTEAQKERLKIRLIQRRKMNNVSRELVDVIVNKFPEKFIILAVIIIVIGLLLVFLNARPVNVTSSEEKPVTQTLSKELETEPKNVPPKPVKQNLISEKEKTVSNAEKRYTIQVAEYADETAAKRFVEKLEGLGYLVEIDTLYRGENKNRPYYKINVGAFTTFNEAKSYNKDLQAQIGVKDSFIKERR